MQTHCSMVAYSPVVWVRWTLEQRPKCRLRIGGSWVVARPQASNSVPTSQDMGT